MTVENKNEPTTERPIMEAMQIAASLLPHVHDLSSMTDPDLGGRLQGLTKVVLDVYSHTDRKLDIGLEYKKAQRREHQESLRPLG